LAQQLKAHQRTNKTSIMKKSMLILALATIGTTAFAQQQEKERVTKGGKPMVVLPEIQAEQPAEQVKAETSEASTAGMPVSEPKRNVNKLKVQPTTKAE